MSSYRNVTGRPHKIRGRGRPILPDEVEQYVQMREAGSTMEEIAVRFDRNPETVRLRLKSRGKSNRHVRQARVEGDIAYIPLTKEKEAIIDATDIALVIGRGNWYFGAARHRLGTGYAFSMKGHESTALPMHHLIFGQPPEGMVVDHRNHNGLDNRRDNLRLATKRQNMLNARISNPSSTGFRCVYLDKRNGSYYFKRTLCGGGFKTPEEAWKAYQERVHQEEGSSDWLTEKRMPADFDPDTGEILDG